MKCIHCDSTVEEGIDVCPYCGMITQIVPDYNEFNDEDLLNKIITDENSTEKQKEIARLKREKNQKEKQKQEAIQNQKIFIIVGIIVAVIVVAVAVILIVVNVKKSHANSFDYQYEQAKECLMDKKYDEAISYYLRAIELDENSSDLSIRYELLDLYMSLGSEFDDSALVLAQEIIRIDDSSMEAYKVMLSIYEKKEDIDAIIKLTDDISDPSILSLFQDYIVVSPTFSYVGDTYQEFIEVELSAPAEYQIYYSLEEVDDLILEGKLYTEPIVLDENDCTFTITAVCVNELSLLSDVVTEEYRIEVPIPERPVIGPDDATITTETYATVEVPAGCVAYYTWDGTAPGAYSTRYTGPVLIPEGTNVFSVIFIDEKTNLSSKIATHTYTYYPNEDDEE